MTVVDRASKGDPVMSHFSIDPFTCLSYSVIENRRAVFCLPELIK